MGLICTTCGTDSGVASFGEGKNLCGTCHTAENDTEMDRIFEEVKVRWPYVTWTRDMGVQGVYNGVNAGLIKGFGSWMLFTNIYGPSGKGRGEDPFELIARVTQWKQGAP